MERTRGLFSVARQTGRWHAWSAGTCRVFGGRQPLVVPPATPMAIAWWALRRCDGHHQVRWYAPPQPRKRKPLSHQKLLEKKEKKVLRKLVKEEEKRQAGAFYAAAEAGEESVAAVGAQQLSASKDRLAQQARQIARQSQKQKDKDIPQTEPWLLYSNAVEAIIDFPGLELVGSVAGESTPVRLHKEDCTVAPAGSRLISLPQRAPLGYQAEDREIEVLSDDPRTYKANQPKRNRSVPPEAVSVVLPSPYLATHYSSFHSLPGGQTLPHFFYTPVGWWKGTSDFLVPATRLDDDPRLDLDNFLEEIIEEKIQEKIAKYPENRMVAHLRHCAENYTCLTAINFFMGRWEMPVPSSPTENTMCLGCPTLGSDDKSLRPLCDRISFTPTVKEIVEPTVEHLSTAPNAIASFGHRCDGEPLLQAELIGELITNVRKRTKRGTIHVNTNGMIPEVVAMLRDSGLDSLQVEVNSVRRPYFNRYVRFNYEPTLEKIKSAAEERRKRAMANPQDQEQGEPEEDYFEPEDVFDKAVETLKTMKDKGGFTSIKYLVLPGLNDERQEMQELCKFIEHTRIDMIQWRNIAIDPEYYLRAIKYESPASAVLAEKLGILGLIETIRLKYPHLRHGYYNPGLDERAFGYNLVEK